MKCKFQVGDQVVCVPLTDGRWRKVAATGLSVPVKDGIYTIREMTFYGGLVGLRFIEIRNPPHDYEEGFHENSWYAEEFQPIVKNEKETNISVFKKMLEPVNA